MTGEATHAKIASVQTAPAEMPGDEEIAVQSQPRIGAKRAETILPPADELGQWKARALAAEAALAAARARAAQIGYRVCAETPHVTLGDKVAAAIRAQGDGNA